MSSAKPPTLAAILSPVFSKLIEVFERDAETFASEQIGDVITPAVGYWIGYPMGFGAIMGKPGTTPDDQYIALSALNRTHTEAVRYLMRLAKTHGLDDAALWEAGRVCRELYEIRPPGSLLRMNATESGVWPDCLGDARYQLPQAQQDAIRAGDAAFVALANVMDYRYGETAKRKGKRGRKPDTNPEEDKRIHDGWKASGYRTYEAYATKNGLTKREVQLAVDRHEKVLAKAKEK